DLLDLPRDPRRPLGLHLVAPERVEGLDEPPRRIDLDVLALRDLDPSWRGRLVARSRRPVRADLDAEAVLRPQRRIGNRLPEALRRRLDVDLEHRRGVTRR